MQSKSGDLPKEIKNLDLIRCHSEEEFLIKNLDDGSAMDIRKNSICFEQLQKLPREALNGNHWTQFWDQLHKTHHFLCDAAQNNDIQTIKEILSPTNPLPVDVNMKLEDQWCALHFAAIECNFEAAELLLKSNASPHVVNIHGKTPLHISALKGHLKLCQLLVAHLADINVQDKILSTPLHYASYYGHADVVEFLLTNLADASIKNLDGLLPVDCALDNKVIQIFNEFGNFRDNYSRTVIGDIVLKNSRADHVIRLLNSTKKYGSISEEAKSTPQQKQKGLNRMRKIEIFYQNKSQQQIGPQDFIALSCLGKGSFGQVFLVKQKNTSNLYAMKVLNKQRIFASNLTRYVKTERNVLSVMNSPFIVRLYYAFQTENKLYLILEYCPGGDLEQQLFRRGPFPEQLVKLYSAEVTLALEELHKNCVIFRDLKPSNIVIDSDGNARLTDFGLSKQEVQGRTKSFCGSMAYLAPEMLERKGHGFSLDWYLLGVVIYELIEGYPPYYDRDRQKLFQNIKTAKLSKPIKMSEKCWDLVKGLLERNPQKRIGAKADAQELKKHPFFGDIDWEKLENKQYQLPKPFCNNQSLINQDDDDSDIRVTFATSAEGSNSKSYIDNWSFAQKDHKSASLKNS